MKKNYLFCISLFVLQCCFAQKNETYPADSSDYYNNEYRNLYKAHWDKFNKDSQIIVLRLNMKKHVKIFEEYSYYSIHTDIRSVDFSKLNNAVTAEGFASFKPRNASIGIATIGFVNKKFMGEINYLTFGVVSESKNNRGERFEYNTSNLFEFSGGLNLFGFSPITVIPLVSVSMRRKVLKNKKDGTYNFNNTPNNFLASNGDWRDVVTKFAYAAGVQLDIRLKKAVNFNDASTTGIIAFGRVSYNGAVGNQNFELNDTRLAFTPKIEPLQYRFGLKFYGSNSKQLSKKIDRYKYGKPTIPTEDFDRRRM